MNIKAVIIILISIIFFVSCRPDNDQRKSLIINGVVISKFKTDNSGCFGSIVLITNGKIDTINDVCICAPPKEQLWNYIQSKDSVNKKSNSLLWKVFRSGSVRQFNYPSCYK